jgi:hypothetical protein
LQRNNCCSIHNRLVTHGFVGCAAYDCFGAGQWVTEHFRGRSWRDSPQSATEMFEAFRRGRALHECLAMLTLAARDAQPAAQALLLEELERVESVRREASTSEIGVIDTLALRREVLGLLHRLER